LSGEVKEPFSIDSISSSGSHVIGSINSIGGLGYRHDFSGIAQLESVNAVASNSKLFV
jgi:hypothetical protein